MNNDQNRILTQDKIEKILKRIAFEVVENNFESEELFIIGICEQGKKLADIIKSYINELKHGLNCHSVKLEIDKSDPVSSKIQLEIPLEELKGKVVIMVDDVMNTGRTQAYSLSHLLQVPIKKLETAVLVYRSHTSFPITATYSGIALSTTIDEHIEVRLDSDVGAYLY